MPEWFDRDDAERRTRAALVRRSAEERWMIDEIIGDGKDAISGYASTLTGGDASTLMGGDASTLTGGNRSTLTGGNRSMLTGGNRSMLTGGDDSTLTGGNRSTLMGGNRSMLTARYWDPKSERWRIVVAYVGEDGIEPNTAYIVDSGKLVKKL
jgi:hypothetical protein